MAGCKIVFWMHVFTALESTSHCDDHPHMFGASPQPQRHGQMSARDAGPQTNVSIGF